MRACPELAFIAAAALAGCIDPHTLLDGSQSFQPKRSQPFVAAAPPCSDVSFSVYFAQGSDSLTEPARAVISAKAKQVATCHVWQVRVVGLADATGAPETNLSLSQKRARRVAEALATSGLPAPVFDVAGDGARGAVRRDGQEEPERRRAEVFLTVRPL
jgi:outer membrane protein OmpA-like peptidoglycan-associated protein